MRFRVGTSGEVVTEYEGSFRVTDSGALSIKPVKGNPLVLSPAYWRWVEITDAPEESGGSSIHYV